jgi:hypothetical protein
MTASEEGYKPQEHFRNLKGQSYLEVKHRVTWFRELVEHDATAGMAMFKARAGWFTAENREAFATGYGSETKGDFADYVEKAETKAIGRALAYLGYGTAQAMDLDEGDSVADSPVERRPRQAQQQPARAQTQPHRRQQQAPPAPQTNDEAEVAALETQHRRLYNAAQRDQEGKLMLLAYLKEQGKTRITEMTMAEATEWLLVFHDREVTPDAPAPVGAGA